MARGGDQDIEASHAASDGTSPSGTASTRCGSAARRPLSQKMQAPSPFVHMRHLYGVVVIRVATSRISSGSAVLPRANGHTNGLNGASEHASPERKGPSRRLPASDDPLDDLEHGPLLSDPARCALPVCGGAHSLQVLHRISLGPVHNQDCRVRLTWQATTRCLARHGDRAGVAADARSWRQMQADRPRRVCLRNTRCLMQVPSGFA